MLQCQSLDWLSASALLSLVFFKSQHFDTLISYSDIQMKREGKKTAKAKAKGRLPIAAVLRLKSYPLTTRKGEKGYERKKVNEQMRKTRDENICEDDY